MTCRRDQRSTPLSSAANASLMFPTLTSAQIARIASHGVTRPITRGEVLIEERPDRRAVLCREGWRDRDHPSVESGRPPDRRYGPGQFTGDVSMILGRPALMRLRVSESGEVVQLTRDQMHGLIQTDAEMSEVLMKAFIYRRIELVAQGIGDVLLIGSVHSAATLRIKAFLTRNGHPFKYLDLDRDADVQVLARSLSSGPRRDASPDLPRRGRAEEPQQPADRRASRLQRADRPGSPARCRHRRRRTGRSCGRGLRGVRGTRCAGHRGQFAWRPGGLELENRELPRISNRDFRPGAGRTRLCPGAEVWRRRHDRERRGGAVARTNAPRREAGRRRDHPGSRGDHRHWRPIP